MIALNALESLAVDLEAFDNVHAAAHHSPSPWIELIVEDRLIGPEILSRIADNGCGIADLATVDSRILVARIEEV